MPLTTSYLKKIRGIELAPGERVCGMLDAGLGLVVEPATASRALIVTDRRFISVAVAPQTRTTEMAPRRSIRHVSIREESRRNPSIWQWAMVVFGGAIIYLALAYWVVDRLPGPIVPVINMHVAAIVLLLLVLAAGWGILRAISRPGGRSIRVAGENWSVELVVAAEANDLMAFGDLLLAMRDVSQDLGEGIRRPLGGSLSSGAN